MDPKPFQIPGLMTLSQSENSQTATVDSTAPAPAVARLVESTDDMKDVSIISSSELKLVQDSQNSAASNNDASAMDVDDQSAKQTDPSVTAQISPPSPPSLTTGLEALLGMTTDQEAQDGDQNTEMQDGEEQGDEQEQPEWEADSSPYESSSDSSSSDSDDSDDDSDDGKELLNPEEMARILMEAASDDEGEGKAKGSASGGQLRTKNELPEEVIPKPDVTITPEMIIKPLGEVEFIVENAIVIKAYTSGEHEVLDAGSVLLTEDRTVVAALADLIGSVREPRYMARFTNEEEIKGFKIEVGTKIFYTPEHASTVFTEPLKGLKGTDASNLNDEEVADEEMEFSDDEKEAAYKKEKRDKKKAQQAARGSGPANRGGRGGQQCGVSVSSASLNYDDEEDGPYRPLARPANFGHVPQTFTHGSPSVNDGSSHRGGRGDSRGGRGRARHHDRGGRGNRNNNRGGSAYSQPQGTQGYSQPTQQQQSFPYPPPPPQFAAAQGFSVPPPPQFFGTNGGNSSSNPQFMFPAWPQPPQNLPANFVPPPPPQFQQQGQPGQPNNLFNPAFFAGIQNQFQGQNPSNGQQSGQWPHQSGSG